MATPHVSGVAAIVWSANPAATNTQLRSALESTALDLGAAGRDNQFGFGLVQALAAADAITGGGGGGTPPSGLSASNNGTIKGKVQIGLAWSGGAATVDVYRGTSKVKSAIANTGTTVDAVKVRGTVRSPTRSATRGRRPARTTPRSTTDRSGQERRRPAPAGLRFPARTACHGARHAMR